MQTKVSQADSHNIRYPLYFTYCLSIHLNTGMMNWKHLKVYFTLAISVQPAFSQQCYVPGECTGVVRKKLVLVSSNSVYLLQSIIVLQLLGTLETFDRFECLGACQEYPGCYWFSSNEENGFCGLFETCEDVSTENCPQCVSGIMTSFQELFLLKSNH